MHPARRARHALALLTAVGAAVAASAASPVKVLRTPGAGIQPQAVLDDAGRLHLLYFKGDPGAGDLYYVRREPGHDAFTAPLRVNRRPGSAIATGTIRGAQFALGRGARIHVAWNGRPPEGGAPLGAPMLYTRLDDSGSTFEPERNLITLAPGLDGGGSVAADAQGRVQVFWHAPTPGNTRGEAGRALFVARSPDEGRTFAPESPALTDPTGACACCGMKAFADPSGTLFASFRACADATNRSQTLAAHPPGDTGFRVLASFPWPIATCPMSSAAFASTPSGTLTAWEESGNVRFSRIESRSLRLSRPVGPPGPVRRRHPAVAGTADGGVLLAWSEGTAWGRGGEAVWQRYDKAGEPEGPEGRAPGLPVWSHVQALASGEGGFLVLY